MGKSYEIPGESLRKSFKVTLSKVTSVIILRVRTRFVAPVPLRYDTVRCETRYTRVDLGLQYR